MATYYVTKAGNDAHSGEASGAAKLTINRGLDLLTGGDTLLVGAGTYDEAISNPDISGTAGAYTKIHALPGETVWLTPTSGTQTIYFTLNRSFIEFDGINPDASRITGSVIRIDGSPNGNPHHIRVRHAELIGNAEGQGVLLNASAPGITGANEFQHLIVHGAGSDDFDHGFYVQSIDNLVEHCMIYDFPGSGVQIYNGSGFAPNGNIVRHNIIRDGRKTAAGQRHVGIWLYTATAGVQVYNNLIYNIPSDGDTVAGIEVDGDHIEIAHNTITRVAGIGISILESASGTRLTNNLSHGNSPNYRDHGSGTVATTNLFDTTDPLFVDPGAGNFRLQAGSGARDTGTTLATVTTDLAGVARPQGRAADVGAYEYADDGCTPPPPGGVFVQDTFTDTAGTDLTQHTGEVGATWTRHPASENIPGVLDGTRCRVGSAPGAQGPFWTASGTPATADYRVTAQIVATCLGDEQSVEVLGRMSPDAYTCYELAYVRTVTFGQAAAWRLGKRVAGAFTALGTPVEVTLTLDQVYAMQLELHGPTIAAVVDGVRIIEVTDGAITAAGRAGVGFWGGDSVGLAVESLEAADRQAGELDEGYQQPVDNKPPPVG